MKDDLPAAHRSALPGLLGIVDTAISKTEAVILALGVLLMALNTIANVVGRFVFGESLFFAEEINRILIVMITFAGIGYAARHGRHIRMSALYDALPVEVRRYLMITIAFFTSAVMFFLCWFAIGYIQSVHGTGRVLPALSIPVYLMYLWVPLGFIVTGVQYFMTGVKNILSRDVYLSTHVLDGYEDSEQEV
ncbi:TRAP transporter small permease [Marinospirillum alkaliphilum]|uniref:TRAP transporter small permease protein n=1 Tax=Marinospirillum alkaliphilum DSM 21637 TaxID=1122209 RepID=A0A1K1Y4G3_9GAMM|nr:TRAP transporter small permease [Marinospirillum alkaliphilum]SFX56890.1 TRAP-type C4-dicarboxylate transport system, small permease component [Marinospirillum alkaliphilum DSM 21637]